MRQLSTSCAAISLASLALACSSNGAVPTQAAGAEAESAQPESEPAPEEEPAEDEAAIPLSEEMAAPHFEGGEAEAAAAAFELERWDEARDGFAAALSEAEGGESSARDRARMRLLKGLAQIELEEFESAADELARAREKLPLLEDYIDYYAARAHAGADRLAEAEELARGVGEDAVVGADAALLVGDILREREEEERVAEHYERYLTDRPNGPHRAEVRYRLGRALETRDGTREDALEHYRRVQIKSPVSEWGERAMERAEELAETLEGHEGEALAPLSARERLERGMAYFAEMRNEKAAADLGAALDAEELGAEEHCEAAFHRAHAWYRARDRQKSAPLFDEARSICMETENEDLQVRAAYLAGRSYAMLREPEASIARHELVEEHHPDHSYADDARIRQAEQYENLGEDDAVRELLATLPELYPDDDMKGEAMWRLAWRAFRDERYEEAIEWLEKHVELEPIAQNYWAEGQAQYWMGRAHAELGDEDASISAYEDAVRTYPLTYYALLSLNRLRESHEDAFEALLADLSENEAAGDEGERGGAGGADGGEGQNEEASLSFEPRPLYAQPGFERGLELLRLGLGDYAEAEFRDLGLSPPSHRDAVEDDEEAEKLWAMSFLYDRAGAYDTSHWPTRWHVVDYRRAWPVGEDRRKWRIAFPNAWYDVLDRHAADRGFSTELQIALVREESAFDPLIESWANAVGLTQLILPTAERFAPGGIDVSRETLRDPDTNARIGARFLDFLHDRYDGHPMLMVPAYNAGEGAVDRWLRRRGHLPADAWVEELRVDQPRRYTKRLLGSYFAYAYLNDGRVPELPNELPSAP